MGRPFWPLGGERELRERKRYRELAEEAGPPAERRDDWRARPIALSPDNFPPADALFVDETASCDICPNESDTILTVPVPLNTRLHVESLTWGADFEGVLPYFTWNLADDSGPLAGYINRSAGYGLLGSPTSAVCRVDGKNRLRIIVTSHYSYTWAAHIDCRLTGWLFSRAEEYGRG